MGIRWYPIFKKVLLSGTTWYGIGCNGTPTIGLITRRSLVQIQPPPPTAVRESPRFGYGKSPGPLFGAVMAAFSGSARGCHRQDQGARMVRAPEIGRAHVCTQSLM